MTSTITHQQIATRIDALCADQAAAYSAAYREASARIEKERASLRELCGGIGHIFQKPRLVSWPGNDCPLVCAVCGAPEVEAA